MDFHPSINESFLIKSISLSQALASFLQAHINTQAATMVKALRASVAKKGKCSTAVAEKEPGAFKGWIALAEFLRKDREELNTECPNWGFQEPIHVISCSETMYGFLAEVKWYTGGSSYVTLPTAVAEKNQGFTWPGHCPGQCPGITQRHSLVSRALPIFAF